METNRVEWDAIKAPAPIAKIVDLLAKGAIDLAAQISLGVLGGDLSKGVGENAGGDGQKALDIIADEAFMAILKGSSVRFYASEEQDSVVALNDAGAFGLAIDPLDGSSNIDVNVSIGTIFSVVDAKAKADATFLGAGRNQRAAGYFIYGPQTALVVSFGDGTHQFILDRAQGQFRYAGAMRIPALTHEFAVNASNHRHWPVPIRAYVDDCLAGENGPRGRNYNMRWIASLVAETHRILSRGGVFLYPGDERDGYTHGRLRMIYECAPIAMLAEQAGGLATDATDPILDQSAEGLHGRTGFVFGSREEVERITDYQTLDFSKASPLFNQRGLFG